ncbi:hypothetical protein KA005_12125, partial [bacterium]|nr:hypothetical protein [bacterium]
GDFQRERELELLSFLDPALEVKGHSDDRTDYFGEADGKTVSFQRAAEIERRNKNAIDNRVDDETRYPSDSGYINGEPVCIYRKRNTHG